jgi:glucose-6-phosphate isomerase
MPGIFSVQQETMVPTVTFDPHTGVLSGESVREGRRTIAGLPGYFHDEAARAQLPGDTLVYRVMSFESAPEGQPGAVCAATTVLEPGVVGDEYFLTRGHFHAHEDRPELEVVVSGRGLLVLMDRERRTWTEPMAAGTVIHVAPGIAHRTVNTGDEPLVFVSYWASETGHDYDAIARRGFGLRVFRRDGRPVIVPARQGSGLGA